MLGRASVALILLLATGAWGAGPPCAVYVHHSGKDTVGERFAFAVKERLSKSSRFAVVDSYPEAKFTVSLTSTDTDDDGGHSSAIAYVFTLGHSDALDGYLTSGVMVVGSKSVQEMADGTVADLDASISKWGLRAACGPQPK